MSREDLASLIVTDPDIVDEGIDVSGLRTTTDTNPLLLANLEPGIKFDPTQQSVYSDLLSYFSGGLPMFPESTETAKVITPQDTDTGQEVITQPTTTDTGFVNTPTTTPPFVETSPNVLSATDPVTGQATSGNIIDPKTGDVFAPGDYSDVAGTLADPREKIDFTPEEQSTIQRIIGAAGSDVQNALSELGKIPGAVVDSAKKTVKVFGKTLDVGKTIASAAINAAAGFPITLVGQAVGAVLPDRDPRQGALEDFYGDQFGLTTAGTIASGVMKGYNPVSGGFLNTITGGKVGDPVNYGLQRTYDKRIEDISGTLADKYGFTDSEIEQVKAGTYTGDKGVMTFDPLGRKTNLIDDLAEIVDLKNKEAAVLDDATDATIGKMFTTLPDRDTVTQTDTTRVNPFQDIDTGVDDFTTATSPVEDFGLITRLPESVARGGGADSISEFPFTVDDLDLIEGQEASAGNIMTDASIVDQPISISETLPEGASKTGTPIDSLNPINRQQHFDNVEKLKDAVRKGEITEEEYNVISAFDARKTMGLKTVDGLAAALGYQGFQAAVGDQSFGEFVGDTALNLQGVSGNVSPELQVKYQEIVTGQKIYRDPILGMVQEPETGTLAGEPDLPGIGGEADIDLIGEPDIVDTPISDMPDDAGMPEAPTPDIPDRGRGTIPPSPPPRDDDAGMPEAPTPSPGFTAPTKQGQSPRGSDSGGGGGGSKGCVIATHAVNSGAFTKDTKREAVRWCVKNLHRTWWGEAVRRGYRYYGQKAIDEGKAKNHYQEFKDYVAFGTGKRRTLKTAYTFIYRTVQFFVKGLFSAKR